MPPYTYRGKKANGSLQRKNLQTDAETPSNCRRPRKASPSLYSITAATYLSINSIVLQFNAFVKSRKCPRIVIPVKTGIQIFQRVTKILDTGFHRCDDF